MLRFPTHSKGVEEELTPSCIKDYYLASPTKSETASVKFSDTTEGENCPDWARVLGRLENLRVKNFDRRSCSGSLSDALPLAAQKLNELLPELGPGGGGVAAQ